MERDEIERINRRFLADGFLIRDLGDLKALDEARDALLNELRQVTSIREIDFANYHEFVSDDSKQLAVQSSLTDRMRRGQFGHRIIASDLEFFQAFIGPDLCVQRLPYVRIARPGVAADNVDLHRDTHYGRSAFELSVWIPFVDIPTEMALLLLPGSHTAPEHDFPTTQVVRPDVERGGLKHTLGFPYAPKKMADNLEERMKPAPVRYGQILIFSLSIVHGQRLNRARTTRFTSDVRVVNALAPIRWEASVSGKYYDTLSLSAVTAQAERYQAENSLPLPGSAS